MTYDTDFHTWTEQQAAALREGRLSDLDRDHLAEEIEELGRREVDALESALLRVVEHLLKLRYSPKTDPRARWIESVAEHRDRYHHLAARNPGLVNRIDRDAVYK